MLPCAACTVRICAKVVSISGGQVDRLRLDLDSNVRDRDGPLALGRLSGRIGIRVIVNALVITIGLSRLVIRHRSRRQRRWAFVIFATAAHGALASQHKSVSPRTANEGSFLGGLTFRRSSSDWTRQPAGPRTADGRRPVSGEQRENPERAHVFSRDKGQREVVGRPGQ